MKYIIVLFYLFPDGKWYAYPLDVKKFDNETMCETVGQSFDGTLADGTLVIHNCVKDNNGKSL